MSSVFSATQMQFKKEIKHNWKNFRNKTNYFQGQKSKINKRDIFLEKQKMGEKFPL